MNRFKTVNTKSISKRPQSGHVKYQHTMCTQKPQITVEQK